jgi:phage baseplate assembly protein W
MPEAKLEVWSDIFQDISTDGQGRIKKSVNIEAVKTSIDNILRTYPGERVMLPEFASRLKGLVFEPISAALATRISDEVKRVIEAWDDRVTVASVDYQADPDRNQVSITVRFIIRGYSETFQHTVTVR